VIARRLPDLLAVVVAIALFVGLAAWQIDLPGLYYDEALDAWPALRVLQDRPQEFSRGAFLEVGGRRLPIMVMEYVGPINTYLSLAGFAAFGVESWVLRAIPIASSALAVIFMYALARLLFSRWVAVSAVLLVAVSPSFIFWSRQGFHVTSIMSLFLYGGLVAFVLWWRSGKERWLILGALAFGLGITAKFLFLWAIVATPLAALVAALACRVDVRAEIGRRISVPGLTAALAAFLAGAAPLIVYNLMTGGTVDVLLSNAVTTDQGVSNLAFGENFLRKLGDLRAVLDGAGQFWFLGGVFANVLAPWLAAAGALLALGLGVGSRRYRWPVVFLALFIAVYLVQSAFTVSGLGATHLFMLIGALQILMVAGFWLAAGWVVQRVRWPRQRVLAVATAALMVLGAAEVWTVSRYHEALGRTGGFLAHSDLIAADSDWLAWFIESQGYAGAIAMDWGIAKNMEIETAGRVAPIEIYLPGRAVRPEFYTRLQQAMDGPKRVWLFHDGDAVVFPRQAEAERYVAERGKRFVEIDQMRQRDGKIVIRVMALE
jgi:4-amino-4-deoxy-L-arabinose transferase-like glycosyltransferase